jgi:hypothetical protein
MLQMLQQWKSMPKQCMVQIRVFMFGVLVVLIASGQIRK